MRLKSILQRGRFLTAAVLSIVLMGCGPMDGNTNGNGNGNANQNDNGDNGNDNGVGNENDNGLGNENENENDNGADNENDNAVGNENDNSVGNENDNSGGNENDNSVGNENDNGGGGGNANDNMSSGGDPAAGEAFYVANGCAGCHGADATGVGSFPSIVGASSDAILDVLTGVEPHPVALPAITDEEAADLEAWLATL